RLILPVGYDSLIVKRMVNKINEKEKFLKLSDGAMLLLEKLKKQKYCLGIITNYNIDVDLILKKLEIFHYFDTIVSTFKTGLRKPSIDIFNKAIALSDYRSSQCAMIGDRLDNDIRPAKRIGMPVTIRFTNSMYGLQEPRNENEIPSYTVSNLSEISNIFT
ncbi:MAG: HAD family hydrolase, partial [Thermoproteota archaeon]|nr:HAD family hydrolase [Thermoproteota archaeon]